MIVNIFDTTINKLANTESNFKDLETFIVRNRTTITVMEDLHKLYKDDKLTSSPLLTLYSEFRDMLLDKHNIFLLLNVEDRLIPQLLTLTHMNVDISAIKDIHPSTYKVICSYPEFSDKILYNITSIFNQQQYKITNITEFASTIVRDVISRKYSNVQSGNWLPSNILIPLTEIYSWIISYNLARIYNLPYNNQKAIAIILAIFFMQRCYGNTNGSFPTLYKQINRLGSIGEINAVEQQVIDSLGGEKDLSIDDLIDLIRELNPDYVKGINLQVFFRISRAFHTNHVLSLTSIEYPPYWLYSIIATVSGENKSNMYWSLQKTGTLKVARELVKTITRSTLFDDVFTAH